MGVIERVDKIERRNHECWKIYTVNKNIDPQIQEGGEYQSSLRKKNNTLRKITIKVTKNDT